MCDSKSKIDTKLLWKVIAENWFWVTATALAIFSIVTTIVMLLLRVQYNKKAPQWRFYLASTLCFYNKKAPNLDALIFSDTMYCFNLFA